MAGFTRAPVCAACLDSLVAADPASACARCGQNVDSPALPQGCRLCLGSPPPFDAAACFGVYDGDLRRLIHLLKYEKMLPLARPLAAKMASLLPRFEQLDCVVPVPLYWTKRWLRGFNQSALLAKLLAGHSGARCRPGALRRVRATAVQAGLSDSERRANVQGAFAVPAGAREIEGKRFLLVDDVMTTGATVAAAANALKAAGASYVGALTLARAVRQSRLGVDS